MKKVFYSLFLLLAAAKSYAQAPTLTQNDAFAIGTHLFSHGDTNTTATPGQAGEQQTWDFSTLKSTFVDTIRFISSNKTLHANLFPNAIAGTGLGDPSDTSYFQVDHAGIYQLDWSSELINENKKYQIRAKYDVPKKAVQFPATYNSQWGSSSKAAQTFTNIPNYDSVSVSDVFQTNTLVDGWGSLKTPLKFYPAALRLVTYHNITSLFRFKKSGQWFSVQATMLDTVYTWWAKGSRWPLLELQRKKEGDAWDRKGYASIYYEIDALNALATDEHSSAKWIYPNPSQNAFYIQPEHHILHVWNCTGKNIPYTTTKTEEGSEIALTEAAPGFYFVQVSHTDCSTRIVKITITD